MFMGLFLFLNGVLLSGSATAERDPQVRVLQSGVRISLIAEHPDLVTPTGIDVDQKGWVWLIASHTHFTPKDYAGPEFDEVLVFDKEYHRRVFYQKTHHTMDLELGLDGWVYLAERDRILRVKDTDGDGKGDLEEDLLLLETEADYPHNGLSGLAWHPNGDLIFGIGENYSEPWVITGRDGTRVQGTGEGGIFRCKPEGTGLHRIARGFWNPFGICVREDGVIFAVDNDPGEKPPCRLLHIVEGGDYGFQRTYGPEAHHPFVAWNGELRGTLPMIHPSGEAPCAVTPVGRGLMVPSWSDHRLYFFRLNSKGASYSAERIELVHGSRYFRPTCIARAPGIDDQKSFTWYVTDWVDGRYQVHGFGRLWKVEIDPSLASWLGPTDLERHSASFRLAKTLRSGERRLSFRTLLQLSSSDDPFLGQAALATLSRQIHRVQPERVKTRDVRDRIQVLLALKLASYRNDSAGSATVFADQWIAFFLKDDHPEIQFEVLRWIADSGRDSFLPEIEKLLSSRNIEYPLFEAAIAAHNTLQGRPEAGIRNPDVLLKRVRDSASDPKLRAFALRLIPVPSLDGSQTGAAINRKFPEGLTLTLLNELLAVNDPLLSMEVVRTLAENPKIGLPLLIGLGVDSQQPDAVRAEAIAALSSQAPVHLKLLIQLAHDEVESVREEALRSVRGLSLSRDQISQLREVVKRFPSSKDLVQACLEPDLLISGRPSLVNTAAWLKRIQSVPGSASVTTGRRIFHHSRVAACSSCHRHRGRGNVVGPDLTNVRMQSDRKGLLESLLQPSLVMAPQYRPSMLVLKDGRNLTGIRLRSWVNEVLRDNKGKNRSFSRSDIEIIHELDESFMPNGLVHVLTDRELRDLLAFLEDSNE